MANLSGRRPRAMGRRSPRAEDPYHAEPWVRQGAFATFLGITISAWNGCYHWQAVAVGDTCLFHTRGGILLDAFPLENSQQFSNAPRLVGVAQPGEDVRQRCQFWRDGRSQPGDYLWAMTDALAQWFLAEQERGQSPWEELQGVLAAPSCGVGFVEWIEGFACPMASQ